MKIPFLPIALLLTGSAAFAGEMPDPKLTPGATDPQVTEANIKETICKETHFSWTEAHMPPKSFLEGIEKDQLKAYGYADENLKHYQMDHLIPLSLGGNATDTKNIWPQPLIAQWSARRKDFLEEKLHEKVCKGEMGLKDAQEEIRADWIASYKKHLGNGDKHP